MSQALSHVKTTTTVSDLRNTLPYFQPYLSDEGLLTYKVLSIPSISSKNNLKVRWINKSGTTKSLVIFFHQTTFFHRMFD